MRARRVCCVPHDIFSDHWMHENLNESEKFHLSSRIGRFCRWKDGAHVLLADKSEAGWYYVPDRGSDYINNTTQGEYTPEHVHHNYLNTNLYKESQERRGKEGASTGEFLKSGKFSREEKWY